MGVADIFDEVNDDLRAERAGQLLRRYGAAAAVVVVLQIAATGPAGYSALAYLQGGAVRAAANDLPGALAQWDALANAPAADPLLRDLASLLWAQRQTDTGPADAILSRLQPLTAPTNPWRALALETQAWVMLRQGQTEQARLVLAGLVADAAAPEGVRGRANAMLAGLPTTGPGQGG